MNETSTSERLLFHLKTRGPATAGAIAAAFGITHMGAHKALTALCEAGLAGYTDIASGRGRPKRTYALSKAGHARFPDRHAELTVELIASVRDVFGQDGLDRLIAEREARQLERYGNLTAETLAQKVAYLARARDSEGYMARVERDQDDLLLIEDHCPICAAAETCQGFCRSELAVFEKILGPEARIEREDHLLGGGRRCTYRIKALD